MQFLDDKPRFLLDLAPDTRFRVFSRLDAFRPTCTCVKDVPALNGYNAGNNASSPRQTSPRQAV